MPDPSGCANDDDGRQGELTGLSRRRRAIALIGRRRIRMFGHSNRRVRRCGGTLRTGAATTRDARRTAGRATRNCRSTAMCKAPLAMIGRSINWSLGCGKAVDHMMADD